MENNSVNSIKRVLAGEVVIELLPHLGPLNCSAGGEIITILTSHGLGKEMCTLLGVRAQADYIAVSFFFFSKMFSLNR